MTDLPERVWIDFNPRDWPTERIMYGEMPPPYVAFVPDDTAIPRAEADAMVGAAYREIAGLALSAIYPGLRRLIQRHTPAAARDAFERAVREAVEAERNRIVKIVASYVGCENIVAAIRAAQETSE